MRRVYKLALGDIARAITLTKGSEWDAAWHLAKASLICGARNRKDGQPCKAKPLPGKARCKWHAGMSTGPNTPEGLERTRQYALAKWAVGGVWHHKRKQKGARLSSSST
jgi:hypothetical protein